jgi:hypothetical protein
VKVLVIRSRLFGVRRFRRCLAVPGTLLATGILGDDLISDGLALDEARIRMTLTDTQVVFERYLDSVPAFVEASAGAHDVTCAFTRRAVNRVVFNRNPSAIDRPEAAGANHLAACCCHSPFSDRMSFHTPPELKDRATRPIVRRKNQSSWGATVDIGLAQRSQPNCWACESAYDNPTNPEAKLARCVGAVGDNEVT